MSDLSPARREQLQQQAGEFKNERRAVVEALQAAGFTVSETRLTAVGNWGDDAGAGTPRR